MTGVIAGVHLVRTLQPTEVALREITRTFGVNVAAPDYLLSVAPGGWCPASEPRVVPAATGPYPGISTDPTNGQNVRVVVVDLGLDPLAPGTHAWMTGVTGDPDPGIAGGNMGPYAGHGTFIAGIIRCMAPAAQVVVKRVFPHVGATFESDLVTALTEVFSTNPPDVVCMSAGSTALDAFGPIALNTFLETYLGTHSGVALVTAAGNNGSNENFWPAASGLVYGVGALAAGWETQIALAPYSNFGGWVKVFMPGTDIINAFPNGVYTYTEPDPTTSNPAPPPPATFTNGMARWSGTSFATPLFAGLVAARMSKTGENGATAADALVGRALAGAVPGVGPVLLP